MPISPTRRLLPHILTVFLLAVYPAVAALAAGPSRADQHLLLEQAHRDIKDANLAISRTREELAQRRQELAQELAKLKRTREELALWAWMADNPWDLRDVMEGAQELSEETRVLLASPDAQEAEIVRQVGYLDKLEARIGQSLQEGLSPETDVQLRLILGDLITLRVRLDDLRTELAAGLKPARDFLASVRAWNESLREELNAAWEPYYFENDPWLSDLTRLKAIQDAWRDWSKTTFLAFSVAGQNRGWADWLGAAAMMAGVACAPWLAARLLFRRVFRSAAHPEASRQLRRALVCASLGGALVFLTSQIGFVLYSMLSVLSEVFFTAALVCLSRGLTLWTAGARSSPRTFTRWPLWGLFCLGLLFQVPSIPDILTTPLFALALLGGAALVWRRGRTAETRLDAALSSLCVAALPALAVATLAGYARAAILATSLLFYLVLSVRLSVAVGRMLDSLREKADASESLLAPAVLSGLGFPLVFLITLFCSLYFASTQFEARDVFGMLLGQELHLEYVSLSAQGVLSVILAFYLTRMAIAVTRSLVLRQDDSGRPDSQRGVAAQTMATITAYVWWALFILCALFLVGFSPTGLAVVAGGLSVGIGFGLQNIVSNFISGLILLFGRSVEPEDVLVLGGEMVVVRRVNIRNTVAATTDGATVFVPNSELITGRVTNLSHHDPAVRRVLTVGVAYGSDRALVRRLLLEAAARSPRVLKEPKPSVVLADFAPSSLEYGLRVWITEPQDVATILSGVREIIDDLFRENGVEISFPQTDVHLRSAAGLATALDAARTTWNAGPAPGPQHTARKPDDDPAAPETPGRSTT
jgi:small-conductance mechanosensitive channel